MSTIMKQIGALIRPLLKPLLWLPWFLLQKLAVALRLNKLAARWHKIRYIYRKLTSPPPDPLMAAMMSVGETIDIDEDPTELHGNRVFVLIASFFTIALGDFHRIG
jgi:hypothetical protein